MKTFTKIIAYLYSQNYCSSILSRPFLILSLILFFCLLYKEQTEQKSIKECPQFDINRRRSILLYSTWRSGSSFIGGLFESNPGRNNLKIHFLIINCRNDVYLWAICIYWYKDSKVCILNKYSKSLSLILEKRTMH